MVIMMICIFIFIESFLYCKIIFIKFILLLLILFVYSFPNIFGWCKTYCFANTIYCHLFIRCRCWMMMMVTMFIITTIASPNAIIMMFTVMLLLIIFINFFIMTTIMITITISSSIPINIITIIQIIRFRSKYAFNLIFWKWLLYGRLIILQLSTPILWLLLLLTLCEWILQNITTTTTSRSTIMSTTSTTNTTTSNNDVFITGWTKWTCFIDIK